MLAPLDPRNPVDLGDRVHALPADGTVPHMPGWRAVHTPGNMPGHVALFRDADRILIPGDALATVRQESAISVATQSGGVEGPPLNFTPDRDEALASARRLAALQPAAMVPSHGQPETGAALREGLRRLATEYAGQKRGAGSRD